ncbi:DUF805 domain-containing protein [Candidatus Peregrinibacteria bacterium]|nr:DUF805 domain-containing protein [Candidatus Peregrinibacteria bacterium]
MAKILKKIGDLKPLKQPVSYLSYEGTLPRGQFIKTYLILAFINYVAYTFAPFISPAIYEWLLWSTVIFTTILSVFQIIKRLRDLNRSPYLIFVLLIPIVDLYVIYLLFFKKQ